MSKHQTFLDISIGKSITGKVIFDLYDDLTPQTVENFIALCTGSHGIDTCSGVNLSYKGCKFFRVVPGFICQSGDIEKNDGTGGRSIFGSTFSDESYSRRHAQAGVLAMANKGKNTNQSQFFITLQKAPQLDGRHVVFGQVVSGMDIIRAIEKCPIDSNNVPRVPIIIENCGLVIKAPRRNLPINQLRSTVEKLMASLEEDNKPTKSLELNLLERHAKKLKEQKEPATTELGIIEQLENEGESNDVSLEEFEKLEYKSLVEAAELVQSEKTQAATSQKNKEDHEAVSAEKYAAVESSIFNIDVDSPKKAPVEKNLLSEFVDQFSDDEDKNDVTNNTETLSQKAITETDSDSDSSYEVESKPLEQNKNDYENRFKALSFLLNESRTSNAKEVANEVKSYMNPSRQTDEEKKPKKYNKHAWNLNESAYVIESWDNVKKKKQKNRERAFGWNAFTDDAFYRAHEKRTVDLQVDPEEYAKQILKLGTKFYDPTAALVSADFKPSEYAKDRLVAALEKEKQKKRSFRRRRMYIEEENVQYINNFNRAFNEKLERAYGEHSLEIKQNLERGTAL